jgi:glycosyltransferase involved in cell wall biosynthesis
VGTNQEVDVYCVSVYSGLSFINTDVASFLIRLFGKPLVFHLHGGALPEFVIRYPGWGSRVLSRGDILVVPSPYLLRHLSSPRHVLKIIPNVIDLRDYSFRLRSTIRPRLFWMRSFHEIWNPLMALRVLNRLRRDGLDATLVMAGQNKGMLESVREEARELGILASVCFAGFLDVSAKRSFGEQCDIFINTNRIDNAPVALIEAWAMGLPVVSTNVGGIPELVTDGETGLLVASDDDESMADKIRILLGNSELTERLSNAGRKRAEQCSWDIVRPKWEDLFFEVMTNHERGSAQGMQ